jgi:hypothetical protein
MRGFTAESSLWEGWGKMATIASFLGKRRKFRKRKRRKPIERQQPECKEKHRNSQRRANHEQHPKLSKLSARHDTNANAFWA